ncbi:MAG TPA: STAS domain-containing protein [Pyrinomonadaceae bacterium]|nr:STAS domain-containing protein [Pyrinomonadaceae bacterium]
MEVLMSAVKEDYLSWLNINERQAADVTVLELEGNLIIGEGSSALRNALRRLIREGKKKVLLDLTKVNFIDSNGIGELVSGLIAIKREDGQLKLLNVTQKALHVLDVTGLLSVFNVFEDEGKALNDFRAK